MKILLLEDNKKLNETITKRLKLKNYNVISFTDGSDAYENITEGFSCFILDINVPNIDGINILKKIREYCSSNNHKCECRVRCDKTILRFWL